MNQTEILNSGYNSRNIYVSRINTVMDYVERNLQEELPLEKLANVAMFSSFHFHRIFAAVTGETINQFVKRIRLEKAASYLMNNPSYSISEIGEKVGFTSPSVFARAFKEYSGLSASDFRSAPQNSKISQVVSNYCKVQSGTEQYFSIEVLNQKILTMLKSNIEVKQMPELNLVYVRHTGDFMGIGLAFEKLMRWAGPRGLLNFPDTKTVTVYHDDPAVTSIDQVRQSACITVTDDVKTEGEVGQMTIPGGKFAVGRFEIDVTQFKDAWDTMCLWLSQSGYQPADGYPYEYYYNDHNEHPEKKFILDICLPVKPL